MAALAGVLAGVAPSVAHEAPHDRIVTLDAALARTDPADAATRAELLLRRGEQHRQAGHTDDALADFADAAALVPDRANRARSLAARTALDAGRPGAALASIAPVVEAEPGDGGARLVVAQALAGLGRAAEAALAYDAAIARLERATPEVYLESASALMACDPPRPDDAIARLDDGLARLGPVVTLVLRAIELEAAAGRHDAALARLDAFRRTVRRQETWLVERARILRDAGRPDEARRDLEAARAAIAGLPSRRRSTAAVRALEGRIAALDSALDRDRDAGPVPAGAPGAGPPP